LGWLQSAVTITHTISMRRSIPWCKLSFSSYSVVSCAFSALCAYSTIRHHPHPLGYLCAKFRFCCARAPNAELVRIEKLCTQSITYSPGLFDVLGTASEKFTIKLLIQLSTSCSHCYSNQADDSLSVRQWLCLSCTNAVCSSLCMCHMYFATPQKTSSQPTSGRKSSGLQTVGLSSGSGVSEVHT